MSKQTLNLTPDLYQYLLDSSLREPPFLQELREETDRLPHPEMQIAPDQGQFFAMLLKLMNARNVIDIGTFTGYSTLVFALTIPENGQVITCDINIECTNIAKKYWEKAGVADKIVLNISPALNVLDQLLKDGHKNQFDFIFLDADKRNNENYYEQGLLLLRAGGVMAIDNVLWHGRVIDNNNQEKTTEAIRLFNQKISQDPRVDLSMITLGDGVTLARKRT